MSGRARRAARAALLGAVAAGALAGAGCGTLGYYWQAVDGHFALMARREPIEELVASQQTTPDLRARLAEVARIRDFSVQALGLPDNGSYRSYADLQRRYAVWTVVAAPELDLTPKTWCFPVAGCVSYRGYFREEDARSFAERLRARGFEVYVGGARAYSTLGWFDDPMLDTMLDGGMPYAASVVFHELAHQRLYVPGDSAFNEAFATAVARAGVRRWLERHGDDEQRVAYERSEQRRAQFLALVLGYRERLGEVYTAADLDDTEKRARKAALFAALRAEYVELRARWSGWDGYDRWFESDLNNAKLASVATYHVWVPAFEALLEQQGGDLESFYRACEALAVLDTDQRQAALSRLNRT